MVIRLNDQVIRLVNDDNAADQGDNSDEVSTVS